MELESPHTKLFSFGVEGGGATVYQTPSNKIIEIGSSGIIQDENEDPYLSMEKEFDTWNDWWQKFITDFQENWVRLHPIYIHESVKLFIKNAFMNYTSITIASMKRENSDKPNEPTLSHWLFLLNE